MAVNYRQLILDMYIAANPNLPTKPTLETVSVADQFGDIEESEENKWRNTSVRLFSTGGDNNPFENSIECHYKRLDANITGDDILEEDRLNWEDDTFILTYMNTRLKESYPDDEFVTEDLTIRRMPSESDPTHDAVFVLWNHYKFLPPQGSASGLEFIFPILKTDLSTTNGKLDGFSE